MFDARRDRLLRQSQQARLLQLLKLFLQIFREFLSAFVGIDMPEREGAPDILEVEMSSLKI